MITRNHTLLIAAAASLGGCDMLKPRLDDTRVDAPPGLAIDASHDSGTRYVLPPGASVPSIADNAELLSQIKVYDGLSDSALAAAGGVVTRSTGKAAGVTVMYWNFGSSPVEGNFAVSSTAYVLCDDDGAGTLTPRTDHPYIIDTIPGDPRYSALHRFFNVPVTSKYAGERITSLEALLEANELGLVGDPVIAGTWRNMPVVPTGTKLELGAAAAPMPATEVYGKGYRIELIPLGGAIGLQPLRNNAIPMGQELRLLSGVAAGTPPALPTSLDAQPVFQYGIPLAPPTTAFNYTPLVTEIDVRLATGVDPTTITNDTALFKRSTSGSISGYYPTSVDSYVVTTTVSNKQIQFADGAP